MRHLVGADACYLFVITGERTPQIDEDHMDLAELRAAMEADGAAWSALLAEDPDPDTRRGAPQRRVRDPRPDGHPARAGAASRDRSSEPDLHRAHHARRGTAVHRRLGLRLARTAASSRSNPPRGPPPLRRNDAVTISYTWRGGFVNAEVNALLGFTATHAGLIVSQLHGPSSMRLSRFLPGTGPRAGQPARGSLGWLWANHCGR